MRRDQFAAEENIGKYFDEVSGYSLYPYKEHLVKEWTIWRCINPHLFSGMLMVKEQLSGHIEGDPEDQRFDAWSVRWRSNDGEEQGHLVFTTQDILESFEPVFTIIK